MESTSWLVARHTLGAGEVGATDILEATKATKRENKLSFEKATWLALNSQVNN